MASQESSSAKPASTRRKRVNARRKLEDVNDRMEVIEEEEDSAKTYIKPELRARAEDVKPTSLHVIANLYQQNDALTVSIPILPEIPPIINYNDPHDYRDYNGRLSSMFAIGPKKTRKDARPPPSPPLDHRCKLCVWSFVTPSALARHVDTHFDMGVYVCQACLTIFNHAMNIYEHWRYNCTPLSHDYTLPAKEIPVHRLRESVFTEICMANHTNMFNMFDGQMFIPSEQFLANPNNIVMQQHIRSCHFCALDVPTKFLECHGDVHRGRFRIDKPIYSHYFCHLCAMAFKSKKTLISHWRSKCTEVVMHTPDEYVLDDDELVALAFLVLQQTVPHKKMASMMEYSMFFFRKMKRDHANANELLKGITSTYYYFPQEIWPMQTYAGFDLIQDSFPLSEDLTFAELAGRVHNCNLLATACPDFYATGMEFNEIRVPGADGQDALLRTVLRFTTHGSVIKTYKINGRSFPRLRPRFTIEGVRSKECNTDRQVDECRLCKEEKATSSASAFRHNKHLNGLRHKNYDVMSSHKCPVCNTLCVHSKEEHWSVGCKAIQIFVDEDDWKCVDEKFVVQLAEAMKKNEVKPNVKDKKSVVLSGSSYAIRKVRDQIVKEIEKARARYSHMRSAIGRAREPENEQMVTICPHCGGKYHSDGLLAHMEARHGYGEDTDDLLEVINNWRQSGCRSSYEMFSNTVKALERAGKPVAPIMTEEQYENATKFVFSNDTTANFTESPWIMDETKRQMSIAGPLLLLSKPLVGNKQKVLRSDPDFDHLPYFPEVTDNEHELASSAMPNQWLRLPRRARRVDHSIPLDPFSGRPYPEKLAAVVRAASEKFLGNSKDELKKIGLNINYMTELFNNQDDEEDENDSDSDLEENGNSDKEDMDGSRHDFSDEEDDDDYDDEGGSNNVFNAAEIARMYEQRQKDVADALQQQKEDSKRAPVNVQYNPADFEPMPMAIHPRHRNMMKYLTTVIETTSSEKTPVEPPGEPLALNLMLENKMTVVHDNCREFREKYLERFPYGETNQNYIPAKLANKKYIMVDHTDFDKDQLQLIVDESNFCFIGGIVLPKTFPVANLHYFYIRMEDPPVPPELDVMALRLRIYLARDKQGDFKFAWPARNEKVLNEKYFKEKENKKQSKQPNHDYALRLTRIELVKTTDFKFARVITAPQRLFAKRPRPDAPDQRAGNRMTKHGQKALIRAIEGTPRRKKEEKKKRKKARTVAVEVQEEEQQEQQEVQEEEQEDQGMEQGEEQQEQQEEQGVEQEVEQREEQQDEHEMEQEEEQVEQVEEAMEH